MTKTNEKLEQLIETVENFTDSDRSLDQITYAMITLSDDSSYDPLPGLSFLLQGLLNLRNAYKEYNDVETANKIEHEIEVTAKCN